MTSFDVVKFDDAEIYLIEKFPCKDKMELLQRERFHIESMDCINKYIPGRSRKEYRKTYYQENKEKIKIKNTNFRQENKEYCKNYQKNYYINIANKREICEQHKIYNQNHKQELHEMYQKYRNANKEKIKTRDKNYYEANKEEIRKKNHEWGCRRVTCACGQEVSRKGLLDHQRRKPHKDLMKKDFELISALHKKYSY